MEVAKYILFTYTVYFGIVLISKLLLEQAPDRNFDDSSPEERDHRNEMRLMAQEQFNRVSAIGSGRESIFYH